MNWKLRAAIPVLALASLGLAAAPARAQEEDDVIEMRDGKKQTARIESEDASGVTITIGKGAKAKLPWAGIKRISYSGSPKFNQARGYVEVGNLQDGIGLLTELSNDKELRPVLRNHVLNWLGAMQMRVGQLDPAISTFNTLFTAFPSTQYLAAAGENLVNCYLAKGNAAGAGDALNKVKAGGVDPMVFSFLRGRVAEAQRDWGNAQSAYKQVADGAADESMKSAGQLGIGRCLFAQGKVGEAETIYRKLVTSNASATVLAGAWNGIGDILYKGGREKRDAEVITDALFAYLRGSVLYLPGPGEPTTELERALAGSAKCFNAVSELEAKPERKQQFAARARERLEYLSTRFPASPYLKEE